MLILLKKNTWHPTYKINLILYLWTEILRTLKCDLFAGQLGHIKAKVIEMLRRLCGSAPVFCVPQLDQSLPHG
jgi:hypothetical protein